MILDSKKVGQVVSVNVLAERLDAARSVEFKRDLIHILSEEEVSVILNLSAVKFMDSTGLGAMVSLLKMVGTKRDLVLCGVSGMLVDLFKLTRMDRVFVIVENEAEALKKLNM